MDLNRWPVYEFRPLPGTFRGEFRRYANGAWLPDDGEHDVAFIGHAESGDGWTFPCCLYIDLPYYENIVCSWLTGHWSVTERRHPRGNAWHHALREGATEWGEPWGRDSHLNYCAGREGMAQMASDHRCCNGRLVEMHANDPHIAAGLLRERDTKRVFTWPESVKCMYCGDEEPLERSP